jgi:hypothetical protein
MKKADVLDYPQAVHDVGLPQVFFQQMDSGVRAWAFTTFTQAG